MVFISNQYNLLYLVNPKCASVSIREFLKKNIKDNEMLQNKIGNEEYKNIHHHKIKEAKQMCINIGKNYDDYFSFTIIRNPWEKVISLYFYDKPDSNNRAFYENNYDSNTVFHHSFNDWLNWAINNNKFNLFKIENFL